MTKRLKSKHKVDRRLKANIWGRPKSPFNSRAYPPGQHGEKVLLRRVRVRECAHEATVGHQVALDALSSLVGLTFDALGYSLTQSYLGFCIQYQQSMLKISYLR